MHLNMTVLVMKCVCVLARKENLVKSLLTVGICGKRGYGLGEHDRKCNNLIRNMVDDFTHRALQCHTWFIL